MMRQDISKNFTVGLAFEVNENGSRRQQMLKKARSKLESGFPIAVGIEKTRGNRFEMDIGYYTTSGYSHIGVIGEIDYDEISDFMSEAVYSPDTHGYCAKFIKFYEIKKDDGNLGLGCEVSVTIWKT